MAALNVHTLGSGARTIVLLHGTPSRPLHFEPLARALVADGFRVLIPELPGYGGSRDIPVCSSVEATEALLEEAILARDAKGADLLGYSGGAYHVLALALRKAVTPRTIVSLGGLAGLSAEEKPAMAAFPPLLRGGLDLHQVMVERCLTPRARSSMPDAVAEVRSWADVVTREALATELEVFVRAPDLHPSLPGLAVPILARVGTLDVAAPPAHSHALAAAPRCTVQVVPDVGHALLLEDFAATAAAIRAFLAAN